MKLAVSILIAGLAIIGSTYSSNAAPVTCDQRGCSDWNSQTTSNPVHHTKVHYRTERTHGEGVRFLPHPSGCPRVAFCACGAAVEVFGKAIRSLWPARAWFEFPRTHAAPGMVAVRSHHVFVLVRQVAGNEWVVIDHNSGGHKSREWVRNISGYRIVNPHASKEAKL